MESLQAFRSGFCCYRFLGLPATGMFATWRLGERVLFTAINTTNTLIHRIWGLRRQDWMGLFSDIGPAAFRRAGLQILCDGAKAQQRQLLEWVTATWEDGSESEPAMIDFCESRSPDRVLGRFALRRDRVCGRSPWGGLPFAFWGGCSKVRAIIVGHLQEAAQDGSKVGRVSDHGMNTL